MLDLDEAISHAEEVASCGGVCGLEHAQLAAWLRELREARAVIAKALSWDDRGTPIRDVLREAVLGEVEQAAADEREACAAMVQGWDTAMTDKLAAAIRARGAKGCEKC